MKGNNGPLCDQLAANWRLSGTTGPYFAQIGPNCTESVK
ncbi:hypothetical protein J2Z65_005586 [Paenibacillus aceris]|uniref:Uncharacterized protein n=1 Tax=Paenibacillus aceris TaxID=869555 RepID=A0ABS4I5Y8_9BACL|nr:hypothetical protein [Paenibacillus aceris]